MPTADQTTVYSYTGNGVTTSFAYGFKIFINADLKVTVDGVLKTLTTDYTVTGAGNDGGGNVVFVTPPASLAVVTISGEIPYNRTTDYTENGDFRAQTIDDDLDKLTMLTQQLHRDTKRAIKLPVEETDDKGLLFTPAYRANKVLAFDAAGAPTAKTAAEMSSTVITIGDGLALESGNLRVTEPVRQGIAAGTVDVITATVSPAPAALTNNLCVLIEATGANTSTTPTLNLNGLGAKTIVRIFGGISIPLGVKDIAGANHKMMLAFDLSLDAWVLLNPSLLPQLTTAQRDAVTPTAGMIFYNTTISRYQWFVGGSWLDIVDTNSTDTLAGKTLTNPKILTGGSIQDGGGDKYIEFVEAATPVNFMRLENANTGSGPKFSAQGTDAIVDLVLEAKGATGKIKFNSPVLGTRDGSKASNTVYQAPSDLFVRARNIGPGSGSSDIHGYTDANSPPTTEVNGQNIGYAGTGSWTSSISFEVKKGDYWKVTGNGTITIYVTPLGA